MQHAIQEAAICMSIAHSNIVSTYHYVIVPLTTVGEGGCGGAGKECSRDGQPGLQVCCGKQQKVQAIGVPYHLRGLL
jgi:hypothetical protein